jgi:anti-anti-sigma factor
MAIQEWSDSITVVDLADDPQFTDDLTALAETYQTRPTDVVLNLSAVGFINSSNLTRLLRLRKLATTHDRRLVLCGVNSHVQGVFHVTGLDRIFKFTNDIATALASLQLAEAWGPTEPEAAFLPVFGGGILTFSPNHGKERKDILERRQRGASGRRPAARQVAGATGRRPRDRHPGGQGT